MRLHRLLVCSTLFLAFSTAKADLFIDGFSDFQDVSVSGMPTGYKSASDFLSGGSILGTERDLFIERTSNNGGSLSVDVNSSFGDAMAYASSPATFGRGIVTYDGIDGSNALDYTGLGGVDLTDGGQYYGLTLHSTSDLGASIRFTIYTDETHYSTYLLPVLADPTFTFARYFADFADFTDGGVDGGADFSNVGAITMELDGTSHPGTDIGFDYFAATVPEPSGALLLLCAGVVLILRNRRGHGGHGRHLTWPPASRPAR